MGDKRKMTDKEMAKKYRESLWRRLVDENVEEAWLAGLNEGRPKWHKVADGDLPKNRHNVWITYINAYYQTETTEASFRHKYWVINGHRTECDVVAWCEIPQYTEK